MMWKKRKLYPVLKQISNGYLELRGRSTTSAFLNTSIQNEYICFENMLQSGLLVCMMMDAMEPWLNEQEAEDLMCDLMLTLP